MRSPSFVTLNEKPLQGVFLTKIFGRLLGYSQVVGAGERYFTPAVLAALRSTYTDYATPLQHHRAEASHLEKRLADLVNQAYHLTPEEIALLWKTAPPHMPIPALVRSASLQSLLA